MSVMMDFHFTVWLVKVLMREGFVKLHLQFMSLLSYYLCEVYTNSYISCFHDE